MYECVLWVCVYGCVYNCVFVGVCRYVCDSEYVCMSVFYVCVCIILRLCGWKFYVCGGGVDLWTFHICNRTN